MLVRTGLKQGDSLSSVLFDISLDNYVTREMNTGQMGGVRLQGLPDRHGLILVTESQNELESLSVGRKSH